MSHATRHNGSPPRASAEPTDSALRNEYRRLEKVYMEGIERDRDDVESCLERERRFTVDYGKMSRNQIWAEQKGPACVYYDGNVQEYMGGQEIWPWGRNLQDISVYSQIYDFVSFMWNHTKPYKTVGMILLMSISHPFQVATVSWIAESIEENPTDTPLWLYFAGFYGYIWRSFGYWWYEMWVPLNSQRVQLRCLLLKQRALLPETHPLAKKWPPGRFNGLLKDVDQVINGIWQSFLNMIDDLVTMTYLLILCFVNLAASHDKQGDPSSYGAYVAVFLVLGIFTMLMPFVWFCVMDETVQECETMIRDGQALYMSASHDTIMGCSEGLIGIETEAAESHKQANETAVQSYWVYGRTTFRSFFHRLAWNTNYGLMTHLWGPLVAYGLLTGERFGGSFDTTNILIVLLSLKELTELSMKVLSYLVKMSRGCNVLRDVADLLNAKADDSICKDTEEGNGTIGDDGANSSS